MATQLQFYTVDAFTKEPFAGNAAAVFVLPGSMAPRDSSSASSSLEITDELCQKIANEFNLAETAFVKRWSLQNEGESGAVPAYSLRFWTPTYEIPLCGHATLASASTLFDHYHPEAAAIEFETRLRGSLVATRDRSTGLITLDLPRSSLVTLEDGHRRRERILENVEKIVKREQVLRIDWADEIAACVVELSTEIDLPGLEFDPFILLAIGDMVILTQPAPENSGFDIYSRVFGPDTEIPEDPVTGAAHTALGPFWLSSPSLNRLRNSTAIKNSLTLSAKQVSKRGGEMIVTFDKQKGRVQLSSWAKQVMKGSLQL
ncbi:hypothetical protein JCM3765_001919 [Sporobolomyces pararoseus]